MLDSDVEGEAKEMGEQSFRRGRREKVKEEIGRRLLRYF